MVPAGVGQYDPASASQTSSFFLSVYQDTSQGASPPGSLPGASLDIPGVLPCLVGYLSFLPAHTGVPVGVGRGAASFVGAKRLGLLKTFPCAPPGRVCLLVTVTPFMAQ